MMTNEERTQLERLERELETLQSRVLDIDVSLARIEQSVQDQDPSSDSAVRRIVADAGIRAERSGDMVRLSLSGNYFPWEKVNLHSYQVLDTTIRVNAGRFSWFGAGNGLSISQTDVSGLTAATEYVYIYYVRGAASATVTHSGTLPGPTQGDTITFPLSSWTKSGTGYYLKAYYWLGGDWCSDSPASRSV